MKRTFKLIITDLFAMGAIKAISCILILLLMLVMVSISFEGVYASVYDGKYGKAQVFDCSRSPATPRVNESFTASAFKNIFDDVNGGQFSEAIWGVNSDRYIQFVGADLALKLYDKDGTFVQTISPKGNIYGFGTEGFLYVSSAKDYGYFVSNSCGYPYGGSVTYTPYTGLATSQQLADFEATKEPLTEGETVNNTAAPAGVTKVDETIDGKNNGKILGVDSTMEYKLSDGDYKEITETEIDDLSPGTYYVRYKAKTNYNASEAVALTIASGVAQTYTIKTLDVAFDNKAYGYTDISTKPISITSTGNWETTISKVSISGDAFVLNETAGTTIASSATDKTTYTVTPKTGLAAGTYEETVTIVYNNDETITSKVSFTVNNAAVASPTGVTKVDETIDGKNNGKILGVDSTMEYKLSDGDYKEITETEIDDLSPGTYYVRYKAKTNYNASEAVALTIAAGAAQTYTITTSDVAFDNKAYGCTDISAKPISITSTGNWETTISKVSISGDAFNLNETDGTTIASSATDKTTYTVTPKTGLAAGVYEETVTIAYNNDKTIKSKVRFTVKALPVVTKEGKGASVSGMTDEDLTQLFTKEELEQAALEGKKVKVLVEVETLNPTKSVKNLIEAGTDQIGLYLDISVYKYIGEDRSKVEELPSEISITYNIPKELQDENKNFYIIREHDGVITKLKDLDDNAETITFKTDEFSTYALAYTENSNHIAIGDNSLMVWILLTILSVIAIAVVTRKLYKN